MRRLVAVFGTASLLVTAGCGGGGSSHPPVSSVPVTTASSAPVTTSTTNPSASYTASAFVCPSADSTTAVAVSGGREGSQMVRRLPATGGRSVASLSSATTTRLAVTYAASTSSTARTSLAARVSGSGGVTTKTLTFANTGLETQIVSVPSTQAAAAEAALRAQAGVKSVAVTGGRRLPLAVAGPTYTNDPYFEGFQSPAATTSGTTPASTYEMQPLVESADVPGQWEMHVTQIDRAFSYASTNPSINGSGITNAGALGSSSVKIAIIDTGMDTSHPELSGRIVQQRCFITNPTGTQSTSNFVTDPDGHGTDVTGLAAAAANNNFGFAGAGGASVVLGYRVQPTPDDNCTPGSTTAANDPQCSADTADVAAAINSAVASGANVISMSLGGGACTNGADPDPVEGQAVANAIAANVVVVAASGNDGTSPIGAPACDTGVIAVGASAIADGQPNGASNSNGSASAPTEYVASYSDYGSPGAAIDSASAWGIVAPGGDPASSESTGSVDDLHWIENLWTSTPYMSSSTDTKFEGTCTGDYPSETGATDCRTLIAGTSMSTPIVAGTAALIIAANPAYQSASKMKALLCSTADEINDTKEGCGRLNAYRAMAQALGDPNPPGPAPLAARRSATAG